MNYRIPLVLAAVVLAAGCNAHGATPTPSTNPVAASCHLHGQLPDPACTPGVPNPNVTQANIHSTICVSGWTATIRPPVSYTDQLKRQQIRAYGYTDTNPADYEEDHFLPLSLGGHPTDPRNLWPERGQSPNPKDKVEFAAQRAVCSGRLTLTDAQHRMVTDWVAFGAFLGVR